MIYWGKCQYLAFNRTQRHLRLYFDPLYLIKMDSEGIPIGIVQGWLGINFELNDLAR